MTPTQLRSALARLGLTQVEAAKTLGVNLRTIERYAAGKSPIPKSVELALEYLELVKA